MTDKFKTQPYNHQLTGLNISCGREFFADLSEMGTGKTWTRINEAAQMWGEGKLDAVMIFAPKGVHSNWIVSQIPTHMPDWCRTIAREWNADANKRETEYMEQLFGSQEERTLRVFAANWDALQYDRAYDLIKQFCMLNNNLMIIGDEAQRIKNPTAIRTKQLNRLRQYSAFRRIMSGSAILQGPFDLYAPFSFLDEMILGTSSYFAFKTEYAEMLQPGNKLLDHIVKARRRMTNDQRAAVSDAFHVLHALLDMNGRPALLEVSAELYSAMESSEYDVVLRKTEQLREMFDPNHKSQEKTAALVSLMKIDTIVGAHYRKMQRPMHPRRLPQIVAKGAGGKPKYKNLEKLHALIAPHSYRVLKKDCLDLPEKVYTQSWFHMTVDQAATYRKMKEEARLVLSNGQEAPVAKLATLMKLSQICSGFIIEPITKQVLLIPGANNKIELLRDRLEDSIESGNQIIIWARFREEIAQIVKLCGEMALTHCEYHGGTSDGDRKSAITDFQSGALDVFIGQQRAGGTGITLTAASHVIYYSNTFSLEDRLQSEDRAHRIGQRNNVLYEDLLCDKTIDVKIVHALRNKKEIADIINGDVKELLDGTEVL